MSTTNFFDTVALPRELRNALKVEVAEPDPTSGGVPAHATSHATLGSDPILPAAIGAESRSGVQSVYTAATRTLADIDHNQHQILNTASNAIAIQVVNTLPVGFSWTARMSSAANAVTFATGGGFITPTFYGKNTATAVDTLICVFVESSTVANVIIVEKVP